LNLNKVIVKVKCVSSWLCLLRNYVRINVIFSRVLVTIIVVGQ
jgi:hypothetical protein